MIHLGDIKGRNLEVLDAVLVGPVFCVLFQYLPFVFQICLIPNQHRGDLVTPILGDVVIVPVLDTLGL